MDPKRQWGLPITVGPTGVIVQICCPNQHNVIVKVTDQGSSPKVGEEHRCSFIRAQAAMSYSAAGSDAVTTMLSPMGRVEASRAILMIGNGQRMPIVSR